MQEPQSQANGLSWKHTLWVLWWIQFLTTSATTFGVTIVPFFLAQDPALRVTDPHLQIFYTSLILAAPFFTTLWATPIWGWLGDRTGRKRQVLRATLGLGCIQVLMGFAQSPEQLILIRTLQGMVSGVVAANLGLLTSVTPSDNQGRAITMLQSATPMGTIFGPVLGSSLAALTNFRMAYFLFGGIILFAAGLAKWLLYETPILAPPNPNDKKSTSNPFRALSQTIQKVWQHNELRTLFMSLMVAQMAWTMTQIVFAIYAGKLIQQTITQQHIAPAWWNRDIVFASLCVMLSGGFNFLMAFWWGRAHDRKVPHLTPIGALLIGASTLLLALWPPWWVVLLARIGMGSGMGGALTLQYPRISALVPNEDKGQYMALATTSTHIGNLVGFLCGGALAQQWGLSGNFILTSFLYLGVLLLALKPVSSHETKLSQEERPTA